MPPRPARSHPAAFPGHPLAAVTVAPSRRPGRNEQASAAGPPPRRARAVATDCRVPPRPRPTNARSASATALLGILRQRREDLLDQRAAPRGGLVHHAPARRRHRHQHGTPVRPRPVPPDQPLADQPVAHPARRRRRHAQRRRQVHDPLRPARGQHHQRPVLRDRRLLRRRAQRPRRHRDQRPARRQHRVHHRRIRRILPRRVLTNFICICQCLHSAIVVHYVYVRSSRTCGTPRSSPGDGLTSPQASGCAVPGPGADHRGAH